MGGTLSGGVARSREHCHQNGSWAQAQRNRSYLFLFLLYFLHFLLPQSYQYFGTLSLSLSYKIWADPNTLVFANSSYTLLCRQKRGEVKRTPSFHKILLSYSRTRTRTLELDSRRAVLQTFIFMISFHTW